MKYAVTSVIQGRTCFWNLSTGSAYLVLCHNGEGLEVLSQCEQVPEHPSEDRCGQLRRNKVGSAQKQKWSVMNSSNQQTCELVSIGFSSYQYQV